MKGRLFAKYDLPFDMDAVTSQKKKSKSTSCLIEKETTIPYNRELICFRNQGWDFA